MAYKLPYTGEEFYNRITNELATRTEVIDGVTEVVDDITLYLIDLYTQLEKTLLYREVNPITSTNEDTVEYWASKPNGIYQFSNNTALAPDNASYGYLIHIHGYDGDCEIQQEYIAAPIGTRYVRGSNQAGWNGAGLTGKKAWKRINQTALS